LKEKQTMLKQNLTKVIAVATIAAGSLFITACGGEEEAPLDSTPPGGGEKEPTKEELPPKPGN